MEDLVTVASAFRKESLVRQRSHLLTNGVGFNASVLQLLETVLKGYVGGFPTYKVTSMVVNHSVMMTIVERHSGENTSNIISDLMHPLCSFNSGLIQL